MYKTLSVVNNVVPFIPKVAGAERYSRWLFSNSNKHFSKSCPLRQVSAPVSSEPFLNGSSTRYIEGMYKAWLEDPASVHKVSLENKPNYSRIHLQ